MKDKIIPFNEFIKNKYHYLAIGINSKHKHTGILFNYQEEDDEYKFYFHFMGPQQVGYTNLPSTVYDSNICINIEKVNKLTGFIQEKMPTLIALVNAIKKKGFESLEYAFKYEGGTFDLTTGELVGGVGLTCSTFIVAFFKTVAINLIDYENWEIPNDEEQKYMKKTLLDYHEIESKEVFDQIMQQFPCSRIMPLQVLVSALYASSKPAPYEFCNTKVTEFLELHSSS